MKFTKVYHLVLCFTCCLVAASPSWANDKQELAQLLENFLQGAGTNSAEQHNRFWAEDLVYTSSSGSRFGKAEIMSGLTDADAQESPAEDAPVHVYSAEEVDIRTYGSTAIVAFKLVGKMSENGVTTTTYYYNTGTFLKRNGQWQAVAWQATKIPPQAS